MTSMIDDIVNNIPERFKNNVPEVDVPEVDERITQHNRNRLISELQAGIVYADARPRNMAEVKEKIQKRCSSPEIAEKGMYRYMRGNEKVLGPSIRLVETIWAALGNTSSTWREVSRDAEGSYLEITAWDLETNTRSSVEIYNKHELYTAKKQKKLTKPRDIYENNAAVAMRRLRACMLRVIPLDIQELAIQCCNGTIIEEKITPEIIDKMLAEFQKFGITKMQIEKKIGHDVSELTPADRVELLSIFQTIRDDEQPAEKYFDNSDRLLEQDIPMPEEIDNAKVSSK